MNLSTQNQNLLLRFSTALVIGGLAFSMTLQAQDAAEEASQEKKEQASENEGNKPASLTDRISYSYGVIIARQMGERGVDINLDQFMSGFKNIQEGKDSLLSELEIGAAFQENQRVLDEKNASGDDKTTLVAGREFREKNAKKEGVQTTTSGLQYEVLKEGDGPNPGPTDEVEVHYHGTLLDGTVFDSSVDRGEPISFGLNRVIPGWTEGVQLMKVGSKYKFVIPYDLAYGERAAGEKIKPYSTLIFEVELLGITGK